ncbi:ATP-grasp domain-containing protein [Enterococcus crotali]|uniref:ATP-grasp domain-containing protein n=1 Tax=Enterococcus crotali TaxID=1453587 RepID=UPI00046EC21D|nr:ATP-grasp domain-containing protein [Enterococcus crotali]
MMKVLVLGVAAVQYDAIKFIKETYQDVEVHAIAMKNDGIGSMEADVFTEINIINIDEVIHYVKENNINLIYSVGSDIAMPVVSKVSELTGLPHFISSEVAQRCNKKDLMRSFLGEGFKGNIKFQALSNVEDFEFQIFGEYPIFLKPADSQGQRGVIKINSHQQLLQEFENTKSYSRSNLVIIEKYVDGPEISVNGYLVNGVLKVCEVSDRVTWQKFEGLIHKHILPAHFSDEIFEKTARLLQMSASKMGIINGPVYAQMKVEQEEPYIIEITPRLDGCHMWNLIYQTKNFNLLKLTFDHLLFNDLSELENYHLSYEKQMTLEFLCQEPNTKAKYLEDFADNNKSFRYYEEGDIIRPINNRFEKIAYRIF